MQGCPLGGLDFIFKVFKLGIPLRRQATAGTRASFKLLKCILK